MKVGIALNMLSEPPRPDVAVVSDHLAMGDLAEPLGFDSLFALEHHFTGYAMSPAPLELLAYHAGRTKRVILGTVAVKEPGLVKAACKQWPGQIAVGIYARDGMVAVDGWTKQSTVRALDLALRFEDAGVSAIIYTDIDRDGAMGGVNIDATITLAQHLTTPVIASGGVSSLDDLRELRPAEEHGIIGAIVGRALYDGRVTVPDAIRVLKGE